MSRIPRSEITVLKCKNISRVFDNYTTEKLYQYLSLPPVGQLQESKGFGLLLIDTFSTYRNYPAPSGCSIIIIIFFSETSLC